MKGHEEGNTFLELEITFDHPQSSMDPLNVEYRWGKWRLSKIKYTTTQFLALCIPNKR